MSYKIYSWHGNPRGNMVRIAAEYADVKFEFVNVTRTEIKEQSYLNLHALGKVPLVDGPDGKIFETFAILSYFARKVPQKNLLGKGIFEEAQVHQWLNYISDISLGPLFGPIFAELNNDNKQAYVEGRKELLNKLQTINNHLLLNTYLVGNQLTIADIALTCILNIFFNTILDEGYRKGHLPLARYYKTIIGQPIFKKYYRKAFFVEKDWVLPGSDKQQSNKEQKPKQEKQQQKPKEQQQQQQSKKTEKKEESEEQPKPNKNPLDLLPPSNFNLFDFKTYIVNEGDRNKAIEEFWKQYDPQGYSIWHIKYDKYEGEGVKLFATSNLKDSFLQRLDHFRKYSFGTYGVYGEEGNYEVEGVWVWRGTEIPQEIKDLPNYEYHFWTKLDHTKEQDKALLNEFWSNTQNDKSVVKGQVARDVQFFK